MSKSEWESRVMMLLQPPDFYYSYKPIDGPHGGAVKIDHLACDYVGRFWMIETKWVEDRRTSINLMKDVSALQRDALSCVADSNHGVALLAVGNKKTLYLWHWRHVEWLWKHQQELEVQYPDALPLLSSPAQLRWNGKKTWTKLRLYDTLRFLDQPNVPNTVPTPIRRSRVSHVPEAFQ